jgi:hypothetical protein
MPAQVPAHAADVPDVETARPAVTDDLGGVGGAERKVTEDKVAHAGDDLHARADRPDPLCENFPQFVGLAMAPGVVPRGLQRMHGGNLSRQADGPGGSQGP